MKPSFEQFVESVADMRWKQREYFRTRSQSALRAARHAEARVDKMLGEMTTPSLFDDDDQFERQ